MSRILVVDDEAPIRELVAAAFSHAGFAVMTAADALEGMALCTRDTPDAVLSDVQMPGMDGHEFARWLARQYPALRCVLMTGFDVDCTDCPYPEHCAILKKPFRPQDAVTLVARVLEQPLP